MGHHARHPARIRRGFTLIEAAIVTVIVGIGIVAMLQLLAAGSMANNQAAEMTTAMNLAATIHERALKTTYDNIMSLDGVNYAPPINAVGTQLTELSNWKQSITVDRVLRNKITFVVAKTQQEPTSRVTVTIYHNNEPVYSTSWIAAAGVWTLN